MAALTHTKLPLKFLNVVVDNYGTYYEINQVVSGGSGYVAGKAAQVSFLTLLNLAAVLSVSIGFANLLPIPILDGAMILTKPYRKVELARRLRLLSEQST